MCELLSDNSLFVSQLFEDKSLTLHTRDLIFLTTDLQTVLNLVHNNSVLELIYFLNKNEKYHQTFLKTEMDCSKW